MTTITSLDLCTVPLTEEGVERYKISDPVSNHLTSLFNYTEDLNCSVGRIFNKIKVPVSWITVNAANYIKATMEFNNPSGSTLQIYGWIDAVDPISDTDGYAAVEVKWHFDYWEMYKSSMTFGFGHIKRRPYNGISDTPIQNYQYRYLELPSDDGTTFVQLSPKIVYSAKQVWWVILTYNEEITVGGVTTTYIRTISYPVWLEHNQYNVYYKMQDEDDSFTLKTVQGPSLGHILQGSFDEIFGIDPKDIIGAWLSPLRPQVLGGSQDPTSGDGSAGNPFYFGGLSGKIVTKGGYSYGLPYYRGGSFYNYVETTLTSIMSTEENHYVLVGMDGTLLKELPYGMSFSKARLTCVCEVDGPYLELTLRDLSLGNLEGCTVNIPLPGLPINSNAWSSYVYSGQRDYDKDMRVVQSNTNAWKSSAGGGAGGAMMGAFGPAGAAVGIVGGIAGGLIGYGVEMLYTNDEEQRFEDRLAANQPSSLIVSSGSLLTILRGYGITLRRICPDSYSLTQISNTRSNHGVSVDEILSSCDTQIRTTAPTGYYNIQNLIITGAVPKEAKDYVKKKFSSGVKLL